MNCPGCGARMFQGPSGNWCCANCGGTSLTGPTRTMSICDACAEPVTDGPRGGYVCGSCLHTVEPPERVQARHTRHVTRRKFLLAS